MPKGERGTPRPYLRGRIWWIRYHVQGVEKRESSGSTHKTVAVKLLRARNTSADTGALVTGKVTIGDLLDLYLADKRNTKGYVDAEIYVRLHLRPAFGKLPPGRLTTKMIHGFVEQKRLLGRPMPRSTAGSKDSTAPSPWATETGRVWSKRFRRSRCWTSRTTCARDSSCPRTTGGCATSCRFTRRSRW